jgi:hypothetical protein
VMWATAEYRRNCLTVFARGQMNDDMSNAGGIYERPHVIPDCFCLT